MRSARCTWTASTWFTFGLHDDPGQAYGYRIEAIPEEPEERDSVEGRAGTLRWNRVEALEAGDAPDAGPADAAGIRWFPE